MFNDLYKPDTVINMNLGEEFLKNLDEKLSECNGYEYLNLTQTTVQFVNFETKFNSYLSNKVKDTYKSIKDVQFFKRNAFADSIQIRITRNDSSIPSVVAQDTSFYTNLKCFSGH